MDNEQKKKEVPIRDSKVTVWGPVFITLNLEKSNSKKEETTENPDQKPKAAPNSSSKTSKTKKKKPEKASTLTAQDNKKQKVSETTTKEKELQTPEPNTNNSKKVTYVYNLIDHGLNCECVDVKGELLIRSALPVYRKINQGIEFEQITTNQIKLIITSRVLENYQEIFQGFASPKATFRIWILGYKFY